MPDERHPAFDGRCPFCGVAGRDPGASCLDCEMRWEEMECRQLRERLFGVVSGLDRFFGA
jgi:hypothetical protein